MTARTVRKVSAKFAKDDVRTIKFTGDPSVNKCVTIRTYGLPSIKLLKDSANKVWVASAAGMKKVFEAPAAGRVYKEAVSAFWA
jgi:peroxiredoxin